MADQTVHSTLAANRLDPSIEADGHMNAGQGVGGTSESTIQKEGTEHLKTQGVSSTALSDASDSAVHKEGIEHLKSQTFGSEPPASHNSTSNAFASQPPASNPGADDPTGGIAEGSGGVSSTAHIESPVPDENKTVIGSTVDSVKSLFGWSTQKEAQAAPESGMTSGVTGAEATPSTSQTTNSSGYLGTAGAATAGVGASAAAGAAYLTGSKTADNTAGDLEQTKREQESATGTSTGTGLTDSSTSNTAPAPAPATSMSDAQEPSQSELREQDKTADDKPTTEAKGIAPGDRSVEDAETTTGADKQTEDTTDAGQAGAGPGDVGETNKPPAAAGGHSGAVENKSSIPTAGGERLGEKHWGESKIVPDNPKPKSEGEGAGVSSKEGQPTDQVKDNTAANTGGATGGPTSSSSAAEPSSTTEKEGLVDKIKDKLHIGKKH